MVRVTSSHLTRSDRFREIGLFTGNPMALLRLRTQLLFATLLIICMLTVALLFIVRYTVRSELDQEVRQSTDASIRAFQSVQRQREFQLSRTAAMLAELPTLKALMTTEDALTIQDASEPFWNFTSRSRGGVRVLLKLI